MNTEIKQAIKKSRFKQYEIANKIGFSETYFCKKLRYELSTEEKERILHAIEILKKENE